MRQAHERGHARPKWYDAAHGAWFRAGYGALLALHGMSLPILLLAGIALAGGRFRRWRGAEWDVWLLAALYPVGIAMAGAIAGLVAPRIRHAWQAGIAGFAAALPAFLALALAADPHDATPYSLGTREWVLAIMCALGVGLPAGVGIFRAGPKRWRPMKRKRHPSA